MSAVAIETEPGLTSTALYFSPKAHSDQHTAPYPQILFVTSGKGQVSVGAECEQVHEGQAIALPADVLHRFTTDEATMGALAFGWNQVRGRSLIVVSNKEELAQRAAEWFVYYAREAIELRGGFSVALSGGSTPRGMYGHLADEKFRTGLDWTRVHIFWGDDRAVPPTDPQSNYRMAQETLLPNTPIPAENVHRIEAELGADAAAIAYDETLREFFRASDRFPRFDLVLLGLGENGHTASLFPHSPLLHEDTKWVAAEYIEEIHAERITLTSPVINNAAEVMFLVSGEGKADVMWQVWNKAKSVEEHPANLIAPKNGEVMWLVDDAAAGRFAGVRL